MLTQTRGQITVQLDHDQASETLHQGLSEGSQARADLDHRLPGSRCNDLNDLMNESGIDQKVLAEALAGEMPHDRAATLLLRRLAILDIRTTPDILQPGAQGLLRLALTHFTAGQLALFLFGQRHLASLEHLDQVDAKARDQGV